MGIDWSLREGYAWAEDKEHCEEYGRMLQVWCVCVCVCVRVCVCVLKKKVSDEMHGAGGSAQGVDAREKAWPPSARHLGCWKPLRRNSGALAPNPETQCPEPR